MATPRSGTNGCRNSVKFPLLMRAVGVCQMSSQHTRCDDPYDEDDDNDFEELPNRSNKNHVGLPSDMIRRDPAPLTMRYLKTRKKKAPTRGKNPTKKLLRPDNHRPKS